MRGDYTLPLVSIITINYNEPLATIDLLESLQQCTYPNTEIIVVDNASHTSSDPIVKAFPDILFIQLPENIGFAGGNNVGIQNATGDYLLFINNDVVVSPNFLEPLVEACIADTSLAIVSPKILFHNTDCLIQHAGYTEMNFVTLRNRLIGYKEKDSGKYNVAHYGPFAHGACMLVSADKQRQTGFMPEQYFLYYEELDWSLQFRRSGYTIGYVPQSVVEHKASLSTGVDSELKTYFMGRNRLLFAGRNSKGFDKLFAFIYLLLIAFPVGVIRYLFHGKRANAIAYVRGVLDFFLDKNKYGP